MSRIGSSLSRFGILSWTSLTRVAAISSGVSRSTKWKSEPDSAVRSSGIFPWRMRCALVMILLLAACRNTSVRRTTGTTPLSIRSRSAFPGPTEGS